MARQLTPEAVMAAVEDVMGVHWVWGQADCCAAASDVFLRLHGRDPMASLRGQYDSHIGAARLILTWGGWVQMADSLARISGLADGFGEAGEIGLSSAGAAAGFDGRALMICIQPGIWAGKTETGFAILPIAERSWRCADF